MAKRTVYTFDKQITSIIADETNNSVWVAFAKNASNLVILERQSAFEPIQTFFSLSRSVDKIVDMDINSSNIFVAYEDATILGEIFSSTTPITNFTAINRPGGITENPVAIAINSTHVFFLLPGNLSGTNAKIIQYTISGTFVQIVDLFDAPDIVTNATTMTIDVNDDIWLSTNTNPITLVRIFDTGGLVYDFSITP